MTENITYAFRSHFGSEIVFDFGRVTASEDFSHVPDALGTPYTYGTAILGAALCFCLRLFALRRGWQLPVARPRPEEK